MQRGVDEQRRHLVQRAQHAVVRDGTQKAHRAVQPALAHERAGAFFIRALADEQKLERHVARRQDRRGFYGAREVFVEVDLAHAEQHGRGAEVKHALRKV